MLALRSLIRETWGTILRTVADAVRSLIGIYEDMTTVRPLKLCVPSALGVLFATLFAGAAATADTLSVPDEYATIQSAIDAAQEGDEVVIQPGIYNETFNYNGKGITVRSA